MRRAIQRVQQRAEERRAEEQRAVEEQPEFSGAIVWIEQSAVDTKKSGIAYIDVYDREAYEKFTEVYNRIAVRDRTRFLLNFFHYITDAEDEDAGMRLDRSWLISLWPELGQQVEGRNGLIPYHISVFDASFSDDLAGLLRDAAVTGEITDLGFIVT